MDDLNALQAGMNVGVLHIFCTLPTTHAFPPHPDPRSGAGWTT